MVTIIDEPCSQWHCFGLTSKHAAIWCSRG